ncbi:hypothetical protein ACLB2K_017632 [Fragaria x ananassa]
MVDSLWFSALAFIIFITVIDKLFISNKQKYHNLPPSPPSLQIIGHLHLLKQPVHRTLQSLSETYGKVLLLRWGSRKVLLLTSPSAAEECFTKTPQLANHCSSHVDQPLCDTCLVRTVRIG